MRTVAFLLAVALVAGCSHGRVEINASSNTSGAGLPPSSSGTSVSSSSGGLQARSDSRSLAAVIIAISLLAGAIEYSREERPFPSPSELFPEGAPAPAGLAPDRRVSEQDCTRPIDFSAGNLRCK